MTRYEELLDECCEHDLQVYTDVYLGNDSATPENYLLGIIAGNRIALAKELESDSERASILAEELAHHYISSGDILDQNVIQNVQQELHARLLSYDILFGGVQGIIDGLQNGCQNMYELSEYLSVPEKTLYEAIVAYRNKFGERVEFENYDLQLIPWVDIMSKRP